MDATTEHDPDAGFEPAFAAPPNACDAHFHVFGPAEKYAYGSDIRYKPPYEPVERYLKLAQRLGADSARCRPPFRNDLAHHSDLMSPTIPR
jgi:hypothetical protein